MENKVHFANGLLHIIVVLILGLNIEIAQSQTEQVLTVEKGGTLEKMLTDNQWGEVENLTVKGEANKEDLHFIAKIAREKGVLKEINLRKTKLSEVGMKLFQGSLSLKTILLPNSITAIGKEAFKGCVNLEKIILPSELTSIGSWAFSGCMEMKEIEIGKKVSWIGEGAFFHCNKLLKFKVSSKNTEYYNTKNGDLYSSAGKLIH